MPRQSPGDEPVVFLEPGQLTAATREPVPRAHLSKPATLSLWALRVLVVVISAMVVYTFFAQFSR